MKAKPTVERDFKGHFICADDCRWFRTTDVRGKYRVSTLGDLHYKGEPEKRQTMGYNRFYETMVFPLGKQRCECGCKAKKVSEWSEKDFEGYQTEAEAEAGHKKMVAKWLRKTR